MEVRYEGTKRGCHSENVTERGYCANKNSVIPSDDKLHPWNIIALNYRRLLAGSSAIVTFNGKKCVSDKNGIFPLVKIPNSKAVLLECNMHCSLSVEKFRDKLKHFIRKINVFRPNFVNIYNAIGNDLQVSSYIIMYLTFKKFES